MDVPVEIEQSQPRDLTVRRVADLLGMSQYTLYQHLKAGRVPHVRIGTSISFNPKRLADWYRSRETGRGSR